MTKLHHISGLHRAYFAWRSRGWKNLPLIVGVIVWVSSHLLALARNATIVVSKWVLVGVTMKVHLRLFVPNCKVVAVLNAHGLHGHNIVAERLLEFRCHKVVARSRPIENRKVHLEPEEVQEEWHNDQTNCAVGKVFPKLRKRKRTLWTLVIEEVPKVNSNWYANGEEREYSHVLGGNDAAQRDACQEEPLPPLAAERDMSKLVESDVAQNAKSHGKNQDRVKQNKPCLTNVRVIEEHQRRRGKACG